MVLDALAAEPLHCAGCHGTDYLGRSCRGREINGALIARVRAAEEQVAWDDKRMAWLNSEIDRLKAALDVERIATALAETMQAATGAAWRANWQQDEFRWIARQLAAALRERLLEGR
jgi:hypothetical protein